MKRNILLVVVMLATSALGAQTKADLDAMVAKFRIYLNEQQPDSFYQMFSEQAKKSLTPEKAAQVLSGVYQQYGNLSSYELLHEDAGMATYKLTLERTKITLLIGLNKDIKMETFRFLPSKDESATDTVKKEKSNFIYKSPAGNIYGTLALPTGSKKVPVVLIIAGSGPTDRDCNSALGLTSNAFLMLADSLQKAGIASVRYDKRGVGESKAAVKDEASLRFDDYINDAIGIIKMLKEDPRFSGVYVLGHSEGSLIGMIAAGRESVAGYISVAGAGENLGKIAERQYSAQSDELGKKAKVILDSLKKGYTVKDIDPGLKMLFHPSIQPYLRSALRYDPSVEIKKLKIPVVIIQGTNDLQISVADAEMLKKANRKAKLILVDGMNHVLKQAPADREQNFATYNKPELPLSPAFMPGIISFVRHN
jgi:hypothetical protein